MIGKKKGFSPKQTNRELRSMDKHTIGSHVRRSSSSNERANSRASKVRAQRSVDMRQSGVHVSTLETKRHTGAHTRNVNNLNAHNTTNVRTRKSSTMAEATARKANTKTVAFFAVAVVLVLIVACVVGVFAFFNSTNSKLGQGMEDAKESLVSVEATQPYYVLVSADLGYYESAPVSYTESNSSSAYVLVRVDEQNQALSFMAIPANLQVRFSDYTYHPLYEAQQQGDDALISQVSQFAGVDISHYVKTSGEGISVLVDGLSGVSVNLSEEADDPYAGTLLIPAGSNSLNGTEVLTLLRSNNFTGGQESADLIKANVLLAVIKASIQNSGINLATLIDGVSSYVDTDYSVSDLMALSETFSNIDAAQIYTCSVAGYTTTDSSGATVYVTSDSEWNLMLENFVAGLDPNAEDAAIQSVVPADTTVEVRNGAGINGAGAQMQSILTEAGYKVTSVGNTTDGASYPETLVVYTSSDYEDKAKAVVSALGCGRTVNGGDYYSSSAQIIAIVGTDWSPLS